MEEKFVVEVPSGDKKVVYEVRDYAHDYDNRCKFEIFLNDAFVASLEPDSRGYLHVCKNPGNLDETVLDFLAEKIESYTL